ncbi:MAG TPA: PAS domain S-box protein [Candidatus Acidoferrum sp.]|nr:PAS domain S-box protein [Candidatus Acidoferrum sp.]
MLDENQGSRGTTGKSSPGANSRSVISTQFDKFEKRQKELWWLTFLVLFLLGIACVVAAWESIRTFWHHSEALAMAIGLVVLIVLFAVLMWKKTTEISELRGLMRGMEHRDEAPPSDKQLDQLFAMISRSQQGYRDLIDSFDDVLLALSLDGQIRAANRSFSDLVDTPFQQIIGKPIGDFLQEGSGEGTELVRRAMPRFMERRQWSGVLQVRVKGKGPIYYFDCVAHAMMRDDEVHGITVLGRDISALRKNEARFTELFESLQEGIYITTPDGAILDVNPALVRMLGYDAKEEVLKRQVPEIFVGRAERKSIKDQVERQPMIQGQEITLIRKDGTSIVCLNTAAAVRDNSGRVVRYQGALMDITERREMERRLHQQQEFARRLVDSFPDLILVLDTAGHYTFVSPRCKEILGYDLEDTKQMEFGGRTHPEDLPLVLSLYKDMLAGKQTFGSVEIRVRHKLGDWRRIRFNFSPLSDEKGNIEGVVLSGSDVTDLKRLEEQLIQAEKLAAMGQMLAGVAHELNNPLTAILGATELLRERAGADDSTRRQLELTHRQARRAARIVQNLLEFSRPASPQKKPVDLNNLLERTLQLHEHSLRRNNVEVDFHLPADLPGVVGDANQLIQVFLNLITNAEQAIREVRDSGRIQIRAGRNGKQVTITVQDDGVGIRAEALPKIFDPFYTTKRPGGGTGLGLSICMSIIREHGGNIEAEALPAGGSAFTIYLPAATEQPPQPTSSPLDMTILSPEALRGTLNPLEGRAVLVLDDEESLRTLLQEGLSAQGLRVDCAANIEEALAHLGRASYDACLCDLHLSSGGFIVDGREAAVRILEVAGTKKPVVIYMTGDLIESTSESAGGSEPVCLQKPFRISDVMTLLREVLADSPAETRSNP